MKTKIFKWTTFGFLCLFAVLGQILLLVAANDHQAPYGAMDGMFWAFFVLLGLLLPLFLLFLGLWFSHSPERGYPRHWRLLSLIAAVWIVLSIALGVMFALTPFTTPAFYAISDIGPQYSDSVAVDVTLPQEQIELDPHRTVAFTVGVGSDQNKNLRQKTDYACLSIMAEGCVVGGQKDEALWEYEQFTTDPRYLVTVKSPLIGYDELYPNYHETVNITFPSGDTSGTITFELVEYFGEDGEYTDSALVVLYYTIQSNKLTLNIKEGTDGR